MNTDRAYRTDLADESHNIAAEEAGQAAQLSGVETKTLEINGFHSTTVQVTSQEGAEKLGKPVGTYVTLDLDQLMRREQDSFENAALSLSQLLRNMMELQSKSTILVAGLGNRAITPDAIGPIAIENILVTRHLKIHMPETFAAFREVSAINTGVLGTTGVESSDVIQSMAALLHPQLVLVIDALASSNPDRLCRTVQITDTGIVPGSGVGNARSAINTQTLGTQVIAIGVPTVVDSHTLFWNLVNQCGISGVNPDTLNAQPNMIVTPRDIDSKVRDISKLVGYGLNLALHDGLTIGDIDMMIS